MTGPEMNASLRKKTFRRAAALLAAVLPLGACAGSFAPRTDETSPLAPRIAALVAEHREYPRWEDFPKASAPVAPAQVAQRVAGLNAASGLLAEDAARIEWTLSDPDAFAADIARQIESTPVDPVSANTLAEIEAFAEALRQRGKAPPPVDRR